MHADYAAVNEQSGLGAGDGGYQIKVKGNTNLIGSVIASSADADKNSLSTATLSSSDLANKAEYKASSMSVGGGFSVGGGDKKSEKPAEGFTVGMQAASPTGATANMPVFLSAKGKDSNTTSSAISQGQITITNDAAQQALTGKTAAETMAGINIDTSNSHQKLANNFDKAEIEQAFVVTKAFTQELGTFTANRAKDADKAKQELAQEANATAALAQAKSTGDQAGIDKATTDYNAAHAIVVQNDSVQTQLNAEKWAPGGDYGRIATVLQAAVGGNVTGGMNNLIQSAAVGYIQSLGAEKVKAIADTLMVGGKETAESENVRAALHAIVGCAGAAATGQSCSSAAIGAASSVVLNNALSAIEKTDTEHMSATDKENRKNLVGTLIGGIVAAAGGDAAVANGAAQIEMENNYLNSHQLMALRKELENAKSEADKQKIIKKYQDISLYQHNLEKGGVINQDIANVNELASLNVPMSLIALQASDAAKAKNSLLPMTYLDKEFANVETLAAQQAKKDYQEAVNAKAPPLQAPPKNMAFSESFQGKQSDNFQQSVVFTGAAAITLIPGVGEVVAGYSIGSGVYQVQDGDYLAGLTNIGLGTFGALGSVYNTTKIGSQLIDVRVANRAANFDWQTTSNLSPRVFVGQDVPNTFGQGGAVINGRYIRSVPDDISASYQGMGYLDPLSNTFKPAPLGKTMPVDHIYPVKEIQALPGFNRLTVDDQISIIHDRIDVGNFQPLPQTFNSSKGSKLDWSFYKCPVSSGHKHVF